MKKICLFVAVLSAFFTVSAGSAGASTYYLWENYGGTWSDADKTKLNEDDDSMCWAAAAANILAWSGWGNNIGDADQIFSYFQDYWTDEGGKSQYGWEWWFYGVNQAQGVDGWSQLEAGLSGGDFYTYNDFSSSFYDGSGGTDALNSIEYSLTHGYGTVLSIGFYLGENWFGHAITCWGFETDDQGEITGIYITDSDDYSGSDSLDYYEVFLSDDDNWHLKDYGVYDVYYVVDVTGLAAVPIPGAFWFLSTGLASLAVFRKKRLF